MPTIELDPSAATAAAPAQPGTEDAPVTTAIPGSKEDEGTTEEPAGKPGATTQGTPETEEVTLEVEGLTKDDEGNLTYVVNPGDQYSPVYKGKTFAEILKAMGKSSVDKDAFIRKLRAEGIRGAERPDRVTGPSEESEVLEFPDERVILREVAARDGLDITRLTWTKEQWREFETEAGTMEAIEEKQKLQKAVVEARTRTQEETVTILNNRSIDTATNDFIEYAADITVDDPNFAWGPWYEDILRAALNDPKNFESTGKLKENALFKAAVREVRKLDVKKITAKAATATAEEIASARLRKDHVAGELPGRGGVRRSTPKPAASTQEATERIRREYPGLFPK